MEQTPAIIRTLAGIASHAHKQEEYVLLEV